MLSNKNDKIKNLSYRIKRFFQGESGIVERVELVPKLFSDKFMPFYEKDLFGMLPMQVTFENPLGELVIRHTPMTLHTIENFGLKPNYDVHVYKTYKPGDNFP